MATIATPAPLEGAPTAGPRPRSAVVRVAVRHMKDVFTLVNLVAGIAATRYAVEGEYRRAGYAVIIGYLFGDILDGFVARLTRTSNRFGAELDSIVDHYVHVVVPGLILFLAERDAGHEWLGLVAMGALVGMATVRHARLAAVPFEFKQAWCGLPRTISGFAAMSVPLASVVSTRMQPDDDSLCWAVALVVLGLSLLNLAPIPYMTHRGHRAMQPWAKALCGLFLASTVFALVFDRSYTFDVFGFWVLFYVCLGWLPVRADEREAFRAEYRRWSARLY